jgi:hypothetical protein
MASLDIESDGPRRDFPGRRWLSVVLRGLHLVAVIWLGAALLGAPAARDPVGAWWVFATGALLFALDLWNRPQHLRQWAGMSMLLKLALVTLMLAAPEAELLLFWLLVIWSAVFSHAPASFRNAPVFGH